MKELIYIPAWGFVIWFLVFSFLTIIGIKPFTEDMFIHTSNIFGIIGLMVVCIGTLANIPKKLEGSDGKKKSI